MAFPILLNVRYVSTVKNEIFMALSNFSMEDSGLLFSCEYDKNNKFPWGVTINQVKGGDFSYFYEIDDTKKMAFSKEFSNLLNSFHGFDSEENAICIKPEELPVALSEKIFTIGLDKQNKGDIVLIPVGVDQTELLATAPDDIPFFKYFPAGYRKPGGEEAKPANEG
jgi:hypothetical protein